MILTNSQHDSKTVTDSQHDSQNVSQHNIFDPFILQKRNEENLKLAQDKQISYTVSDYHKLLQKMEILKSNSTEIDKQLDENIKTLKKFTDFNNFIQYMDEHQGKFDDMSSIEKNLYQKAVINHKKSQEISEIDENQYWKTQISAIYEPEDFIIKEKNL